MIDTFYTLREMADKFGIEKETLRKKVVRGTFDFKAVHLSSGEWVFNAKEVEAALADLSQNQNGYRKARIKAV